MEWSSSSYYIVYTFLYINNNSTLTAGVTSVGSLAVQGSSDERTAGGGGARLFFALVSCNTEIH